MVQNLITFVKIFSWVLQLIQINHSNAARLLTSWKLCPIYINWIFAICFSIALYAISQNLKYMEFQTKDVRQKISFKLHGFRHKIIIKII